MIRSKIFLLLLASAPALGACGASAASVNSSKSISTTPTTHVVRSSAGGLTTTSPTTTTPTTTSGVAKVPLVASKLYATAVSSPSLSVSISYPQLTGLGSNSAEGGINGAILNEVKGFVTAFEAQIGERSGSPSSASGSSRSQISGTFKTEFVDTRYVSIRFLVTSYAAGAASPSTNASTLTFELSNGQAVTLNDLFTGSTYLTQLSTLAKAELLSKLGSNADQNLVDIGTQPTASNFSNWNLKASGLELTFAQGKVAAVAAGVISIVIPFTQLSGIERNPGPLAQI